MKKRYTIKLQRVFSLLIISFMALQMVPILPITATELWILDYGWVDVSVSSEYDFNLSYEGKQEGPFVKYELRLGNSIINDNSVAATFRDGSSKPGPLETPRTVSLTAELTGHPPYVGSYNDILTFTAEYKESAPANR